MSRARVKIPAASVTPYALDIEDEGLNVVTDPTALNFTGAGVTVTENPAGVAEIDIPDASVQFWTESESAATQQNTRWIPNNVATNVTAVIEPKGNGALTAQRPDGTTAGGNARGIFATDFQKVRNVNSQVASAEGAGIVSGANNTASGVNSFIGGGTGNQATNRRSIVLGGENNQATGTESVVLGGSNSVSSGANGSIAGGTSCVASGGASVAMGISTASSLRSVAFGESISSNGRATSFGVGRSRHGGALTNSGSNVNFQYYFVNVFSNGGYLSGASNFLGVDGGQLAGQATTQLGILNNQYLNIKCMWIAVVEAISGTATGVSVGDYMIQVLTFGVKKVGANPASITSVTTISTLGDASITATATLIHTVLSDLRPTFTAPTFAGGGTLTMRVHAQYEIIENTY